MKNKLLSIILFSVFIINILSFGNVGFCATVSDRLGNWYVQNHTPTEGSYVTDEGDGNIKITTSGQNMLELIRYPENSSGCDIATIRFGIMFEDTSITRLMAVRGTDMSTHNSTPEITALHFSTGGKCRIGNTGGDTFAYETGKWYDFSVNIFLRTGHIVAEVESDGTTNTYSGNLSQAMYDLWRVYFIAFSYGAPRETNYHIRNFEIIDTPHVSSYPENGVCISPATGKLKITFPTEISSVSSIRLNGAEVEKKNIAVYGKNIYVWCSLQKNTDYNLKYRGVTNSYGDIYTGELDFKACDDVYLSDIEFFSDGIPTDITDGKTVSAKFNVVSGITKNIRAYAALYNTGTSRLEGIKQIDCTLSPGDNELEISMDKSQMDEDVNMKLFVWNDNLSPIAAEETLPFVRPDGEKVLQDLARKTEPGSHPRLYIDKKGLESLKERIKTVPAFAEGFASIKAEADSLLTKAPLIYEKRDGLRLYPAHNMRPRIQALGLVYAITGEEKYAKRLWQELETACEFPDWNPYHFLDTGVLLVTVAEGYDWAYDYISKDEAKVEKLVGAVEAKGFEPLLDDYLDRPRQRTYNWAQAKKADNWNVICNAGGIMASLAFADESPEYAKQILGCALPLLEKSVIYFAPDGAWFEGISYWSYMLGYFTDILSSLNTSLGTDYGFSRVEGLAKTGYFPFNMSGPGGIFNFSNAGEPSRAFRGDNSCFLLANVLGDKKLESLQYNSMVKGGLSFDYKSLLWYKGDFETKEISLSPDTYYRDTEVCAMKGDGVFVGFRAGSNSVAHSHLDTGSFVLDMEGERFASDLGSEDYNLSTTYKREKYRERAEGHNTLVINPDINPDQIESSFARIDRFVSKDNEACALCDMTSAYADDVISATREVFLENNRSTVRIHDEIKCKAESEIWWFMHTRAEVTLSDDCKTAYLTRNGKTVKAVINSEGMFSVMDAVPLSTSPQNDKQNKNEEYRKLAVCYVGVKDLQIDISFSPKSF
ncbi:MAG: heparinase II/III family protein [Clostridia bacterium]|nr:heparinase II/III family protein [Clostridia bacterium]